MLEQYNPQELEQQAQQYWEENQCFQAKEDLEKEKFYCLAMFPYPSGNLHVGHVRNYTLSDVIARYQRMQGKNVLQPFGWDAFGLPAENAALKHKTAPAKWTYENIEYMRNQIKSLGFGIDWSREITTCDPEYYRFEQWLFTKLYQKGLAYKKCSTVNWDPVDETVLANEQVVDGKGWRSGAPIERREINQWFLKITDYAEELLKGLDQLDSWPEQVRLMQKNWIGKSNGVTASFEVKDHETLKVFTTRIDTLMGATYLAISPEHELAKKIAATNNEMQSFLEQCKKTQVAEAQIVNQEKVGVNSGLQATHPITGESIPIWVCNYVLASYGSGAVMAVPAHDQRDYEFAKAYKLDIKCVIADNDGNEPDISEEAYIESGALINSGEFSELLAEKAIEKITESLISKGLGEKTTQFRLHDWGISRQRYWGTPIPIINCSRCGAVSVPEEDLPVRLPENIIFGDKPPALKDIEEFYQTICPQCGDKATRETDTFDTFMESSWYFLRYTCPDQTKTMLDNRAKYWCPVDQYIGGVEHAVMHLLYARFMHKVLRDEGFINTDEPFISLLTQGMVLKDGAKMSKSKGNTVDPDQLIKSYGADSVRLFIIFTAPPEQSLEWSDSAFEGAHRFLKRLWALAFKHQELLKEENSNSNKIDCNLENEQQKQTKHEFYKILQQINSDYSRLQFNTVISGAMKLLNLAGSINVVEEGKCATEINRFLLKQIFSTLLRVLAPITPHICHYLWQELGYKATIIDSSWPQVSNTALKSETIDMVIQVNGKLRSKLKIPATSDQQTIESMALSNETIQKFIDGKTVKKIIVVPNKLVNIVVVD